MAELGSTTFVGHVRSTRVGAGTRLAAGGVPRLVVTHSLTVTGTPADGGAATSTPVSTELTLLGPGDVVGIATSEVLRVFPSDGEPAAEPNYLAAIEFDSPELPWLLSLSTGDPVRPWIALVVVPDTPGRIEHRPGTAATWLRCSADELPLESELWAWAHAQAVGGASVTSPAPGDGRLTLSRLLCPLKLSPTTSYLAAVVPTYAASVVAAAGGDPSTTGAAPAWTSSSGSIALPVYHHWRFTTGAASDFEALARQLRPVDASTIPSLGRIDLSVGEGGVPGVDAQPVEPVRTLLASPAEAAAMKQEHLDADGEVATHIAAVVDAAPGDHDRVVRPPRYGQWPAGDRPVVGDEGWYGGVNLQPSHRVIARLGADMVRAQQEELVAEAQRQLGAYREARRARDLLRLGEMTAERLHVRAVADVADERVLALARPSLQELVSGADPAVAEAVAQDGVGRALVSPSFTRIARRAAADGAVSAPQLRKELVSRALDGGLRGMAAVALAPSVDIDRARTVFDRAGLLEQAVSGIKVDQLLALAPPAEASAQELVTTFSSRALDVAAPEVVAPDVVAPAETQPQEAGPGIRIKRGRRMHDALGEGDDQPVMLSPELIERMAEHAQEAQAEGPAVSRSALSHLAASEIARSAVVEEAAQQPITDAVAEAASPVLPAATLSARIDIGSLEAFTPQVLEARFSDSVRTEIATASITAAAPLLEAARAAGIEAVPQEASSFADLVVDRRTAEIARELLPSADEPVAQFDVRSAVRRSIGLPVLGPVQRAALPDADRRRCDVNAAEIAARLIPVTLRFPEAAAPVTIAAVAAPCRTGLEAATTFTSAAARRLAFGVGLVPTEIRMGFVPTFDAPLASRLDRALNAWVLAGASRVPPNTITILETNPGFIEALLVGANHEMARELLWRDVPSDPRGTVFRRFWSTPLGSEFDLPQIHTWRGALGTNAGPASPYLCVLVRSPLLRKYPIAVIQAAQGTGVDQGHDKNFEPDPATVRPLLYTGRIAPDMTYSVIALTEDEARQTAGKPWYLLLGEPVSEPKFGLDAVVGRKGDLHETRDLAWPDTDLGADGLGMLRVGDRGLRRARFDAIAPGGPAPVWGRDAGEIAAILHQDPFRLVMKALDFLKGGA